ncbi:MAG TPA: CAP domain-containing protein [Streptosporangiaceae bacterium]|nr:CAP domain-containing protein [Streptosporangiaceae bacterium]
MPRYPRLLLPGLALAVALISGCGAGNAAPPGLDAAARQPATATPCAPGAQSPAAACQRSTPPTPQPSQPAHGQRRHRRHRPAPAPRQLAAPHAPVPAPPSAGGGAPVDSQAIAAVFALINRARARARLPAYTTLPGLQVSSRRHNRRMADGCGLSHQCPGEPPLGTRLTNAGVSWTSAGENCGEGGPVTNTPAAIAQMATGLTRDMLNEKPPNDGHRLNLLSSSFTHVGIAVVRGSNGTVWLTQDFTN